MAANAALAANRDRQWIEEQVKKGPMRTLMKSPRRTPKVYHPWEVESVPGAGVAGDNYLGRAVRIDTSGSAVFVTWSPSASYVELVVTPAAYSEGVSVEATAPSA